LHKHILREPAVNVTQTVPIETARLFPILDEKLIELLKSLTAEEWDKPAVGNWRVKDSAAHLLDGNIRGLSMLRDNYWGIQAPQIGTGDDLIAWLNQINAEWIEAIKRVSPALLIQMHELTGPQYSKFIAELPPFEKAVFPVAWAGERESLNWMHIAREYTEKWHHQQQIRDAVNKPGIMTEELYKPFIQTYMLALPYTYRNVDADNGTIIRVEVTTGLGGQWHIIKEDEGWKFTGMIKGAPASEVILDPVTAWKLFSKNIRADETENIIVRGDKDLAKPALGMVLSLIHI
jgi:hypothetical protein